MVYTSDSHKYNFQLSSIRILAAVRPSWFCRSGRAFSGHFRAHFQQFALQRKRYKSEQKLIIRDNQMFVVSCLGICSKSDFFYKFLISSLLNYYSSAKKWPSLKEIIAKDTLVGILKLHPG